LWEEGDEYELELAEEKEENINIQTKLIKSG
jgi:hypothetical protein